MTSSLQERDFYAWANEQAALLRSGRDAEADLAIIADEIESMGKTEKRELVSRLTILFLHLLKGEHQPGLRGASWRLSVANARDEILEVLADNPSLKPQLAAAATTAYRYARRKAAIETGLAEDAFPATSPWNVATAMDATFWP